MYRLKLGLEVHAQLWSPHKLFSRTIPGFHAQPNSRVSYFDAALPGTQPKLSMSCLNLALRAGLALNSSIAPTFSFDRKHYMYPDQPSGYQITQFREPIAKNGFLDLLPRDFFGNSNMPKPQSPLRIGISQIQMEQDTGKTTYVDELSLIDLNRANTGLIEIITTPSFTHAEQAVVFVRKLQLLLKRLKVCSGEMEAGAMRVDVNVSVADEKGNDLGDRCEIKNLFSTSALRHAVKVEFDRQCEDLKKGIPIERETRGWDGKKTWRLRSKETALDYRYMPDPDLPKYRLPNAAIDSVRRKLPAFPDAVIDELVSEPYNLKIPDAFTIVEIDGAANFVTEATTQFTSRGGRNAKMVGTWLVHRWLGLSNELPQNITQFVDVLLAVDSKRVSTTTGRLLLKHVSQGYTGPIEDIISEFQLEAEQPQQQNELAEACDLVINAHADVVEKIKNGKKNSLGFLLGQVMKETQGTLDPKKIREELLTRINK